MSVARESTGARRSSDAAATSPLIRFELPAEGCCHAVGRLVVGGAASRLDFHVEQIEDLQLAVEALLSRPAAGRRLSVELMESESGLEARLGPFARIPGDRARVLDMLSALVEDAVVQDSSDGEWIVLNAARSRPPSRGWS